jgi:hypothetical protein
MDATVRDFVRRRAGHRCEYCLLKQEHLPFATFHVEHIIPRKHGGDDNPANLALACDRCNAHKGANFTGIDPETGAIIVLFNPRTHDWEEHFRLSDSTIVGLTAVGRTTVRVLKGKDAVTLRAEPWRHGGAAVV